MREIDNQNGFSNSLAVGPFGPNYFYAATHQLITIISAVTSIVPTVFTIAVLVRYFINVLSGRNSPVDVKKLWNFFLFKPDNIFMKTLEATTHLGGFNQRLPMQQSNKRLL